MDECYCSLLGNCHRTNKVAGYESRDSVFYIARAEQRWNKGVMQPLLGNGSVNAFPCIESCYARDDVINYRDGVFRGVSEKCL
jgi:hypothetical protein